MLDASVGSEFVFNEEKYEYMRDIVCFVVWSPAVVCFFVANLFVRWHYAETVGDWTPYEAALGALSLELQSSWRDREHCRGWLVSVVGFWSLVLGIRHALLDRTSLEFFRRCGGLSGADLLANAIVAVPCL